MTQVEMQQPEDGYQFRLRKPDFNDRCPCGGTLIFQRASIIKPTFAILKCNRCDTLQELEYYQ